MESNLSFFLVTWYFVIPKRFPRSQRFTPMFSRFTASAFALRSLELIFGPATQQGPFRPFSTRLTRLSRHRLLKALFFPLLNSPHSCQKSSDPRLRDLLLQWQSYPPDRHACHYRTRLSPSPHRSWGPAGLPVRRGPRPSLLWCLCCSQRLTGWVVKYSQLFDFSSFCRGWALVLW